MIYKKSLLIVCLIICLFSIAVVCASEANDTVTNSGDNLEISEYNQVINQTDELTKTDDGLLGSAGAAEGKDIQNTEDDGNGSDDSGIACESDNVLGSSNQIAIGSDTVLDSLGEDEIGDFNILQNLINEANYGDSITLDRNYTFTVGLDENLVDGIVINKNLAIDGNGYTIDADGKSRILKITANDVELNNITFINANNGRDCDGGVIYWSGDGGSAVGCSFVKNSAEYNGGVIYWSGDGGSAVGCSFVDNSANRGGAIFAFDSNGVDVVNCSFVDNSASDGGGAVYWWGDDVSVVGCSFVNNSASGNGGAIYVEVDNCMLSNCTFIDNSASVDGGAVHWWGGDGSAVGCSFVNNSASYGGGAIYWLSNGGSVVNCTFVDNSACDYGGSVYLWGDDGSVVGCSFVNNSASGNGGAIFISSDNCMLSNCTFIDNHVTVNGDAINWAGDYGSVSNSSFITNWIRATILRSIDNFDDLIFTLERCGNNNYIDAIYTTKSLTFDNVTYYCNGSMVNSNNVPIVETTNECSIVVEVYSNDVLVDNVTLVTDGSGRAAYGYFNLEDGDYNYKSYYAGDIHYASSEVSGNFTKTTQMSNFNRLQTKINMASEGDVISLYCNYTFTEGLDENLVDGIVIDKKLTINGNGHVIDALGKSRIFNITADGVKLNNVTFINANYDEGGAILCLSDGGSVVGCSFMNNSVEYYGGAILLEGSDWVVVNCSFVNNSVEYYGGAILIWGDGGSVVDCYFVNNSAEVGGAVYYWLSNGGSVVGCCFVNNSASDYGGAVYLWGDGDSVVGCSFVNNSAEYSGGAICVDVYYCMLSDCTFIGNSASGSGGAINWYSSDGSVVGCSFVNNSASGSGDAINWQGNDGSISNSMFTNNNGIRDTILRSIDDGGELIFTLENVDRNNNYIEAIYSTKSLTFDNVTYYCNGAMVNSNNVPIVKTYGLTNCNIVVEVYSNNVLVDNVTLVTDSSGSVAYGYNNLEDGDYNYKVYYVGDTYHHYSELTGNFTNTQRGDFNRLQARINQASEGDVITLNRNYTFSVGLDENLVGGIVINKNYLTIDGNGYTIDALGKSRIFYIDAYSVTLNNVNFINANYDRSGGAIYWSGNQGSVVGCSFVNNSANGFGGAFYCDFSSRISVVGCSFVNNSAVDKDGGAIYWTVLSGSVVDCSFVNNSASRDAGAIYCAVFYGSVVAYSSSVVGCSFVNNSASRDAGAIYIQSDGSVVGCSFVNNSASGSGDAINWQGNDGYISNSRFTNNNNGIKDTILSSIDDWSVLSFTLDYVGRNNNYIDAIYSTKSLTFDNVTYYCNGSMVNSNNVPIVKADGLTNCNIVVEVYSNDVLVDNVTLVTDSSGSVAYGYNNLEDGDYNYKVYYAGDSHYAYSELTGNFTNTQRGDFNRLQRRIDLASEGDVITLDRNYTFSVGLDENLVGGIFINKNYLTIDGNGYTIDALGKSRIFYIDAYSVTLKNVNFINAHNDGSGGAIYWSGNQGSVVGCSFVNNSANGFGGAFYCGFASIISVVGCSFVNNSASDGGAIYWTVYPGSVVDCSFVNNSASRDAGAIYCAVFSSVVDSSSVVGCSFVNNSASRDAGAIRFDGDGTVENCNFINNTASFDGGAIYWYGSDGSVVGCCFVNNSASRSGDAINWRGNDGSISNSWFTNNNNNGIKDTILSSIDDWSVLVFTLDYVGRNNNYIDAIYSTKSLTFDNVTYYCNGSMVNSNNVPIVKADGLINCSIVVEVYSNDVLVDNVTLVTDSSGSVAYGYNNLEDGDYNYKVYYAGDSHYAYSELTGNFTNTQRGDFNRLQKRIDLASEGDVITLDRNYTFSVGLDENLVGGIFINKNYLTIDGNGYTIDALGKSRIFYIDAYSVTLNNVNFINANYDGSGGAIYWSGNQGSVVGCSFVNNSANGFGGAIYQWYGSTCSVVDCSFVNNSAGDGGAIYWTVFSGSVVGCSFVNNSASGSGDAINWAGDYGSVSNSSFINNRIRATILRSIDDWSELIFTLERYGNNNYIDAIYSTKSLTFDNVTYYCNGSMVNSNNVPIVETTNDCSIVVEVYSNDVLVDNVTLVTDSSGSVAYGYNNLEDGDYNYKVYYAGDSHYAYSELTGNFTNTQRGDFNRLQRRIDLASEGDVITLDRNYTFSVGLDENLIGGIVINKNYLTIDGNGYTIDALGKSRIFYISAYTVTLNNVNFINANTGRGGGAIYWYGNQGSAVGCSFVNNSANRFGGAIYCEFATRMSVVGCSFVNNSASVDGGAIYWAVLSGSVVDCSFVNNSASRDGGAIYFAVYPGFVGYSSSVIGCSFVDNSANLGSAIFWHDYIGYIGDSSFRIDKFYSFSLNGTDENNYLTLTFEGIMSYGNVIDYYNSNVTYNNISYWNDQWVNVDESLSGSNNHESGSGEGHDDGFIYIVIPIDEHYEPDDSIRFNTLGVNRNIVMEVYSDGTLVDKVTLVTDGNAHAVYDYIKLRKGNYTYKAYHPDDRYGTYIETTGSFTLENALGDDFNSLQTYIDRAKENTTITLCHNYTFTEGLDENLIEGIIVNKTLTIDGNGYTIDAKNSSRIFTVSAKDVVLKNIIFINGKSNDNGGAVCLSGDSGLVSDCSFVNNSAVGSGGAILVDVANCRISDCNFIDNYAGVDGGAVYWSGDNGLVSDCTFVDNSAVGSGGAILVDVANCRVSDCNFVDNYASVDGGALYWSGDNGSVVGCSFVDNYATNLGNAIYVDAEDFKLTDSYFRYKINNTALNVAYDDYYLTFTLEGEVNYMNTIYWDSANVTLSNISYWRGQWVNSNDANPRLNAWEVGQDIIVEMYSGDTLADKEALVCDDNAQAVYDCIKLMYGNYTYRAFHPDDSQGNYIETNGNFTSFIDDSFYALYLYINRAKENSTITLCHNYSYGIGDNDLYTYLGGLIIDKTITIDGNGYTIDAKNQVEIFKVTNDAENVVLKNIVFINGRSDSNGAAIEWKGANGSVVNCTFVNNSVTNPYGEGGAIYWDVDDGMVSGCSFVNNSAYIGGAISWDYFHFNGGGSVVNCSFIDNFASTGGAIGLCTNGLVSGCTFVNNTAKGFGGAISVKRNSGTVVNCSFIDNFAYSGGDAIVGNINVINSSFWYNKMCSALDVVDENNYLRLTFEGKLHVLQFNSYSPYTLSNVTYWNGQWRDSDELFSDISTRAVGQDIVLEVYSGDDLVDNVTLVTDGNGQVVYDYIKLRNGDYTYKAYNPNNPRYSYFEVTGGFTLSDALGDDFTSLKAYIDRAGENATITLTHNYTYNESSDYSLFRGIWINDKTITIDGNGYTIDAKNEKNIFYIDGFSNVVLKNIIFINGKESAMGGGAIQGRADECIICDCYFVNCSAEHGGAISFIGWEISISGCSFVNCSATGYDEDYRGGGAISWKGTGGSIVDCSFVNCSATDGGAIYWNALGASVVNCSFIDNFAADGGAIYWNALGASVVDCSFTDNSANRGGAIYIMYDDSGSIVSSSFNHNKASSTGLNASINNTHLVFTFEGNENYFNAIYLDMGNVSFSNVTYWDGEWANSDDAAPVQTTQEAGQNITLEIYNSDGLVENITLVTNRFGQVEYYFMNLCDGDYSYVAYHQDDDYYTYVEVTGDFTRKKIEPNLTVSVLDVTFGENVVVNVELPADVAGDCDVRIEDNTEHVNLTEGKGSVEFAMLEAGVHTVVVTFYGDGNYVDVSVNASVEVKRASPNLTVSASAAGNGVVVVDVACDADLAYRVNVTVADQSRLLRLKDGKGTLKFTGLEDGTYDVVALYKGDANHEAVSANDSVEIMNTRPNLSVSAIAGGNGIVVVNVTADADLANRVNVTVGDQSRLLRLKDGKGTLKFDGLADGTYTVVALYKGDAYYAPESVNTSVEVKNMIPNITVSASAGGNGVVVVDVACDVDLAYRVNVTVGNQSKLLRLNDGKGTLKFTDFAVGTYTVTAVYKGDSIYSAVSDSASVIVMNPLPKNFKVYAENTYGNFLVVNVTSDDELDYRVNVTVGNQSKLLRLKDGKGSLKFTDLEFGTYTVTALYKGDSIYSAISDSVTVMVMKPIPKNFTVSADAVYYGDDLVVTVTSSDELAYRVNVTVGDQSKLLRLKDGVGSLKFTGLEVGTYTVTALYKGDSYFAPVCVNASVEVMKSIPKNFAVYANDINCGEDLVVTVTSSDELAYRVNVSVGNESKLLRLKNGQGTVKFTGLEAGTYAVTATYVGDKNYLPASADTSVEIR